MYQNVQCQNATTVSFCMLVIADSACGIGMGSHAELQLAQHGACGGGGRILGDIFNMAGRSWCRLTGHRMPQSTTQQSWPVTCSCTGMLWAIRELLIYFLLDNCAPHTARLVRARLVQAPSPGLLRSGLTWVSWCQVQVTAYTTQ